MISGGRYPRRSPESSRRRRKERRDSREQAHSHPSPTASSPPRESPAQSYQQPYTPSYRPPYQEPPRGSYREPYEAERSQARDSDAGHRRSSSFSNSSQTSNSFTTSSTSSSLVNVSRPSMFGLTKFFSGKGTRRTHRVKKKRSKVLRFGNPSSSSIGSDLAYGKGYVDRRRSREYRTPSGQSSPGRDSESDRSRPSKRAQPDEKIKELGRKINEIARQHNNEDLRAAGRRRSSAFMGAAAAAALIHHRPTNSGYSSRGIVTSKPNQSSSSSEETDWESASSDDESSESESDNGLAYGSTHHLPVESGDSSLAYGSAHHLPVEPISSPSLEEPVEHATLDSEEVPLNRKRSLVDPKLFGPVNSLRGFVRSPCGFEQVDRNKVVDLRQRYEPSTTPDDKAVSVEDRPLQRVYPVPTSDPSRFDAARGAIASILDAPARARPDPIPIQHPKPIAPVNTKVLESVDATALDSIPLTPTDSRIAVRAAWSSDAAIGELLKAAKKAGHPKLQEGYDFLKSESSASEKDIQKPKTPDHQTAKNNTSGKIETREIKDLHGSQRNKHREDQFGPAFDLVDERQSRRPDAYHGNIKSNEEVGPRIYPVGDEVKVSEWHGHRETHDSGMPISHSSRDHSSLSQRPTTIPLGNTVDSSRYQLTNDASPTPQYETSQSQPPPVIMTIDREPDFSSFEPYESRERLSRRDSFELEIQSTRKQHGASRLRDAFVDEVAPSSDVDIDVPHLQQKATGHRVTDSRGYSRPSTSMSESKDPVLDDADRAYREARRAQRVVVEEERSRSNSPDRSIIDKWREEEPGSFQVVSVSAVDRSSKPKNIYDGPNADVRIDNVLEHPKELSRFQILNSGHQSPRTASFRTRDPSAERERPMLNLVRPTPHPSPTRNKQRSKNLDLPPPNAVDDASSIPAGMSAESVPLDRQEQKDEIPRAHKTTTTVKVYGGRPPDETGWAAILAAISGTDVKSTKSSISDYAPGEDDILASTEALNSPPMRKRISPLQFRDFEDNLPSPEPKPVMVRGSQISDRFMEDPMFVANIAAGLEGSGFDPNIVIENTKFHHRESPPGSNETIGPSVETTQRHDANRDRNDEDNHVVGNAFTDLQLNSNNDIPVPALSKRKQSKLPIRTAVFKPEPTIETQQDSWRAKSDEVPEIRIPASIAQKKEGGKSTALEGMGPTSSSTPLHAILRAMNSKLTERPRNAAYSTEESIGDKGPVIHEDIVLSDKKAKEIHTQEQTMRRSPGRYISDDEGSVNWGEMPRRERERQVLTNNLLSDNPNSLDRIMPSFSSSERKEQAADFNFDTTLLNHLNTVDMMPYLMGATFANIPSKSIEMAIERLPEASFTRETEYAGKLSKSSPETELIDPEIVEREIRPAIDPTYGDLLPLPPSRPTTPVPDLDEGIPPLPDSLPGTPEGEKENRLERERLLSSQSSTHTRRRSDTTVRIKTPSHSAIPIQFRLGQRTTPGSPGITKPSPSTSPATAKSETGASVTKKGRARPMSWENTKEFKPLLLVEKRSRGPTVKHAFFQEESQRSDVSEEPRDELFSAASQNSPPRPGSQDSYWVQPIVTQPSSSLRLHRLPPLRLVREPESPATNSDSIDAVSKDRSSYLLYSSSPEATNYHDAENSDSSPTLAAARRRKAMNNVEVAMGDGVIQGDVLKTIDADSASAALMSGATGESFTSIRELEEDATNDITSNDIPLVELAALDRMAGVNEASDEYHSLTANTSPSADRHLSAKPERKSEPTSPISLSSLAASNDLEASFRGGVPSFTDIADGKKDANALVKIAETGTRSEEERYLEATTDERPVQELEPTEGSEAYFHGIPTDLLMADRLAVRAGAVSSDTDIDKPSESVVDVYTMASPRVSALVSSEEFGKNHITSLTHTTDDFLPKVLALEEPRYDVTKTNNEEECKPHAQEQEVQDRLVEVKTDGHFENTRRPNGSEHAIASRTDNEPERKVFGILPVISAIKSKVMDSIASPRKPEETATASTLDHSAPAALLPAEAGMQVVPAAEVEPRQRELDCFQGPPTEAPCTTSEPMEAASENTTHIISSDEDHSPAILDVPAEQDTTQTIEFEATTGDAADMMTVAEQAKGLEKLERELNIEDNTKFISADLLSDHAVTVAEDNLESTDSQVFNSTIAEGSNELNENKDLSDAPDRLPDTTEPVMVSREPVPEEEVFHSREAENEPSSQSSKYSSGSLQPHLEDLPQPSTANDDDIVSRQVDPYSVLEIRQKSITDATADSLFVEDHFSDLLAAANQLLEVDDQSQLESPTDDIHESEPLSFDHYVGTQARIDANGHEYKLGESQDEESKTEEKNMLDSPAIHTTDPILASTEDTREQEIHETPLAEGLVEHPTIAIETGSEIQGTWDPEISEGMLLATPTTIKLPAESTSLEDEAEEEDIDSQQLPDSRTVIDEIAEVTLDAELAPSDTYTDANTRQTEPSTESITVSPTPGEGQLYEVERGNDVPPQEKAKKHGENRSSSQLDLESDDKMTQQAGSYDISQNSAGLSLASAVQANPDSTPAISNWEGSLVSSNEAENKNRESLILVKNADLPFGSASEDVLNTKEVPDILAEVTVDGQDTSVPANTVGQEIRNVPFAEFISEVTDMQPQISTELPVEISEESAHTGYDIPIVEPTQFEKGMSEEIGEYSGNKFIAEPSGVLPDTSEELSTPTGLRALNPDSLHDLHPSGGENRYHDLAGLEHIGIDPSCIPLPDDEESINAEPFYIPLSEDKEPKEVDPSRIPLPEDKEPIDKDSPFVALPDEAKLINVDPSCIPLPEDEQLVEVDPSCIPLPEDEKPVEVDPSCIPLPEDEEPVEVDLSCIPLPEDEQLVEVDPSYIPLPEDEKPVEVDPSCIPLPEDKQPVEVDPSCIPLPEDEEPINIDPPYVALPEDKEPMNAESSWAPLPEDEEPIDVDLPHTTLPDDQKSTELDPSSIPLPDDEEPIEVDLSYIPLLEDEGPIDLDPPFVSLPDDAKLIDVDPSYIPLPEDEESNDIDRSNVALPEDEEPINVETSFIPLPEDEEPINVDLPHTTLPDDQKSTEPDISSIYLRDDQELIDIDPSCIPLPDDEECEDHVTLEELGSPDQLQTQTEEKQLSEQQDYSWTPTMSQLTNPLFEDDNKSLSHGQSLDSMHAPEDLESQASAFVPKSIPDTIGDRDDYISPEEETFFDAISVPEEPEQALSGHESFPIDDKGEETDKGAPDENAKVRPDNFATSATSDGNILVREQEAVPFSTVSTELTVESNIPLVPEEMLRIEPQIQDYTVLDATAKQGDEDEVEKGASTTDVVTMSDAMFPSLSSEQKADDIDNITDVASGTLEQFSEPLTSDIMTSTTNTQEHLSEDSPTGLLTTPWIHDQPKLVDKIRETANTNLEDAAPYEEEFSASQLPISEYEPTTIPESELSTLPDESNLSSNFSVNNQFGDNADDADQDSLAPVDQYEPHNNGVFQAAFVTTILDEETEELTDKVRETTADVIDHAEPLAQDTELRTGITSDLPRPVARLKVDKHIDVPEVLEQESAFQPSISAETTSKSVEAELAIEAVKDQESEIHPRSLDTRHSALEQAEPEGETFASPKGNDTNSVCLPVLLSEEHIVQNDYLIPATNVNQEVEQYEPVGGESLEASAKPVAETQEENTPVSLRNMDRIDKNLSEDIEPFLAKELPSFEISQSVFKPPVPHHDGTEEGEKEPTMPKDDVTLESDNITAPTLVHLNQSHLDASGPTEAIRERSMSTEDIAQDMEAAQYEKTKAESATSETNNIVSDSPVDGDAFQYESALPDDGPFYLEHLFKEDDNVVRGDYDVLPANTVPDDQLSNDRASDGQGKKMHHENQSWDDQPVSSIEGSSNATTANIAGRFQEDETAQLLANDGEQEPISITKSLSNKILVETSPKRGSQKAEEEETDISDDDSVLGDSITHTSFDVAKSRMHEPPVHEPSNSDNLPLHAQTKRRKKKKRKDRKKKKHAGESKVNEPNKASPKDGTSNEQAPGQYVGKLPGNVSPRDIITPGQSLPEGSVPEQVIERQHQQESAPTGFAKDSEIDGYITKEEIVQGDLPIVEEVYQVDLPLDESTQAELSQRGHSSEEVFPIIGLIPGKESDIGEHIQEDLITQKELSQDELRSEMPRPNDNSSQEQFSLDPELESENSTQQRLNPEKSVQEGLLNESTEDKPQKSSLNMISERALDTLVFKTPEENRLPLAMEAIDPSEPGAGLKLVSSENNEAAYVDAVSAVALSQSDSANLSNDEQINRQGSPLYDILVLQDEASSLPDSQIPPASSTYITLDLPMKDGVINIGIVDHDAKDEGSGIEKGNGFFLEDNEPPELERNRLSRSSVDASVGIPQSEGAIALNPNIEETNEEWNHPSGEEFQSQLDFKTENNIPSAAEPLSRAIPIKTGGTDVMDEQFSINDTANTETISQIIKVPRGAITNASANHSAIRRQALGLPFTSEPVLPRILKNYMEENFDLMTGGVSEVGTWNDAAQELPFHNQQDISQAAVSKALYDPLLETSHRTRPLPDPDPSLPRDTVLGMDTPSDEKLTKQRSWEPEPRAGIEAPPRLQPPERTFDGQSMTSEAMGIGDNENVGDELLFLEPDKATNESTHQSSSEWVSKPSIKTPDERPQSMLSTDQEHNPRMVLEHQSFTDNSEMSSKDSNYPDDAFLAITPSEDAKRKEKQVGDQEWIADSTISIPPEPGANPLFVEKYPIDASVDSVDLPLIETEEGRPKTQLFEDLTTSGVDAPQRMAHYTHVGNDDSGGFELDREGSISTRGISTFDEFIVPHERIAVHDQPHDDISKYIDSPVNQAQDGEYSNEDHFPVPTMKRPSITSNTNAGPPHHNILHSQDLMVIPNEVQGDLDPIASESQIRVELDSAATISPDIPREPPDPLPGNSIGRDGNKEVAPVLEISPTGSKVYTSTNLKSWDWSNIDDQIQAESEVPIASSIAHQPDSASEVADPQDLEEELINEDINNRSISSQPEFIPGPEEESTTPKDPEKDKKPEGINSQPRKPQSQFSNFFAGLRPFRGAGSLGINILPRRGLSPVGPRLALPAAMNNPHGMTSSDTIHQESKAAVPDNDQQGEASHKSAYASELSRSPAADSIVSDVLAPFEEFVHHQVGQENSSNLLAAIHFEDPVKIVDNQDTANQESSHGSSSSTQRSDAVVSKGLPVKKPPDEQYKENMTEEDHTIGEVRARPEPENDSQITEAHSGSDVSKSDEPRDHVDKKVAEPEAMDTPKQTDNPDNPDGSVRASEGDESRESFTSALPPPRTSSAIDYSRSLPPVEEETHEDLEKELRSSFEIQLKTGSEAYRDSGLVVVSPSPHPDNPVSRRKLGQRDSGVHMNDWAGTTIPTHNKGDVGSEPPNAKAPLAPVDEVSDSQQRLPRKRRPRRTKPIEETPELSTPTQSRDWGQDGTIEKHTDKPLQRNVTPSKPQPAAQDDVESPGSAEKTLRPHTPPHQIQRSVSDNFSTMSVLSDISDISRGVTPHSEYGARRSASNMSISRLRTPELPFKLRPDSPGNHSLHSLHSMRSLRSSGTNTPPLLRRAGRRISSDPNAVSHSNHNRHNSHSTSPPNPSLSFYKDRDKGPINDPTQESAKDPATEASDRQTQPSNIIPIANEGRIRAKDMADVYDGYGEGRIGSPRSPTRPTSMRRRQSMQVLELESRVEQLLAENRALSDARVHTEKNLNQRNTSAITDRDAEIESLKASLQWLQNEVTRLTEVNEGLQSANSVLALHHNDKYTQLESQHTSTARELEAYRGSKSQQAQTLQAKDAEIQELRNQLEVAKEQIRQMKEQILATKPADADFLRLKDVDYFDQRCQQLCSHVQQWVLRFSKFSDMRACRLTSEINDEKIIDRLDNTILDGSDVDEYLKDRVARRDIFMSMTMNMIWEFVFTRYLFGMDREQRQKLKSLEKILTEVGPIQAVRQWRAITLTLLSKRAGFAEQCSQDREAVVQAILQTLSMILPPPSNMEAQIQYQLRRVMREAVELSIEMRTQRAEYVMLPPLQPEYDANGELVQTVKFNAALMHERSGDASTTDETYEAKGAIVRCVLFPLVVKKGDDKGIGDDEIVVSPAQAMIAKKRRSTIRMVTPTSDSGRVSQTPSPQARSTLSMTMQDAPMTPNYV